MSNHGGDCMKLTRMLLVICFVVAVFCIFFGGIQEPVAAKANVTPKDIVQEQKIPMPEATPQLNLSVAPSTASAIYLEDIPWDKLFILSREDAAKMNFFDNWGSITRNTSRYQNLVWAEGEMDQKIRSYVPDKKFIGRFVPGKTIGEIVYRTRDGIIFQQNVSVSPIPEGYTHYLLQTKDVMDSTGLAKISMVFTFRGGDFVAFSKVNQTSFLLTGRGTSSAGDSSSSGSSDSSGSNSGGDGDSSSEGPSSPDIQ